MDSNRTNLKRILRDGRALSYAEFGDPQGRPLFYFHGFPGSRLEASLSDEDALKSGVRIIAPDRPGIGRSDQKQSRAIADWPDDITELADTLGIDKFAVLGVSGGGPYACACGWKIPERLTCIGLVCALGPAHSPELVSLMHARTRLILRIASQAPSVAAFAARHVLGPYLRRRPQDVLWLLSLSGPAADRRILAQEDIMRTFVTAITEAFAQGSHGVTDELLLLSSRWGFSPQDIPTPVQLWHGEADCTVPVCFGKRYSQHLPHCNARFLPDEGHFSLPVVHMREILASLNI